ncbi:NAD(P)/FAD-dependent oxidoreductase [Capillimicrobium parvum]|uniref:Dimethylglycine oxidase n=1 Tax=Capillimicrobium parvum TaxID=2884022 RepID=A0A9E6Y333_9ACTN|nr:FAD-binding oxidoreductase [Capillimicrobium parvum]UGS39003.1 Dimethylglycine oxidase [Capillimicrobium parvum]
MTGPSVVVVGAGAAGLSAALCLVERACPDVTVIDRGHVASGSSSLSAGVFTRQYTERMDIALRVESYERLCQLERDAGLVMRRNGFLRLAHDEATMDEFVRGAALQHELGATDAQAVDRREVQRLVPDLRCDDVSGGLFGPTDGYLDGQQLCMAYAEQAQARGARILARHELTGYDELPGGRHRLTTSRGRLECDVVLNAAGAWAPAVGALLGAPVQIVAERHQACVMRLDAPLAYELPSVMDYVAGSGEVGLYLRPEGERQLIAGLHSNERLEQAADPDDFHGGADAAFIDALIPLLVDRMPGLAGIGFEGGWAGLYPNSVDERFIIGPCPGRDGIHALCGLDGVGVYMSPAAGRIAADWILDGEPRSAHEAVAFSPDRFEARERV